MHRMRKTRCSECKKYFRTAEADRTVCQNCDGSHDNSDALEKEAVNIKKANAVANKQPQSVDPRATLPPEPAKPDQSTASATPKKKVTPRAKAAS